MNAIECEEITFKRNHYQDITIHFVWFDNNTGISTGWYDKHRNDRCWYESYNKHYECLDKYKAAIKRYRKKAAN